MRPGLAEERPCSTEGQDHASFSAARLAAMEVAHDLGNLLQMIGSAIRVIDRDLAAAPRPGLVPIIGGALASVDRATILSRRILDADRPWPSAREVAQLDVVISEMLDRIALAAGPDVQIELEFGAGIPAVACGRDELENVILNLVVNARDAMDAAGRLKLSVTYTPPADATIAASRDVVLRVGDTGCGMPPSVAAQAFRPFFTTKGDDRGTGLGLAIVGAFVARLGGSADIASAVGTGTIVTLRLPASP
jgi:signal transduction histidine kinase